VDAPLFKLADGGGRVGSKAPVAAPQAVCSSQHPIVTDTMLEVMRVATGKAPAAIAPFRIDRFRDDRAVPDRASAGTY